MRRTSLRLLLLVVTAAVLAAGAPAAGAATERVSVNSAGIEGNHHSYDPAISADGRFVAFESWASNLVADDLGHGIDVFVRDRQTGATERVSVDLRGGQPTNKSYSPAISADGRYVAFDSQAWDLVPGDTNGASDVFVRDRQTGVTERVSVDATGGQVAGASGPPAITPDGRYVTFTTHDPNVVTGDTNNSTDVFVRDRQRATTELVSVAGAGGNANANSGSGATAISPDGRFVAFASEASNLVEGDTNGGADMFVRDRAAGVTERVSVGDAGEQANGRAFNPTISADGRYVGFESDASNLVSGDTNAALDVFVHDREAGVTERVSVDGSGSQANGYSLEHSLSVDGRYVAFYSTASNLVAGDTNGRDDVFVRDRATDTTERVSYGAGGQANFNSRETAISPDARQVAFASGAANLVAGDTNHASDIFVRTLRPTTVKFLPRADTRAEEAQPERKFARSVRLRVDGGGDPDARSFLRFSVAGLSGRITSARLRLYALDRSANGPAVSSASETYGTGSSGSWTEWGVNWLSQPSLASGPIDDKGRIAADTWVEYDVSSLVRANGTYSFGLATNSSDGVNFSSREGMAQPELVLTVAYD